MKCAEFECLIDAAIYRRNHGGWLFVTDNGCAYWFDAAAYTASAVIAHPFAYRKSGTLSCDNRYLKSA